MNARTTTSVLACLVLPWVPSAFGQKVQRPDVLVSRPNVLESGVFDGVENQEGPVFTAVIEAEETPWMRFVEKFSMQQHWCRVRVKGSRVELEVRGFNDELIEEARLR